MSDIVHAGLPPWRLARGQWWVWMGRRWSVHLKRSSDGSWKKNGAVLPWLWADYERRHGVGRLVALRAGEYMAWLGLCDAPVPLDGRPCLSVTETERATARNPKATP